MRVIFAWFFQRTPKIIQMLTAREKPPLSLNQCTFVKIQNENKKKMGFSSNMFASKVCVF